MLSVLYVVYMLETVNVAANMDGKTPGWWPYAREFPGWEVWRGVDRLYYASRRDAGPPARVRGEDAVDLRDQIRAVILRAER
jgi:hypothetical protein